MARTPIIAEKQRPQAFMPDAEDFDRHCALAGIQTGEEPMAFAVWLNSIADEGDIDAN